MNTTQFTTTPNPNRELVVFFGPKPKPKPKPRKKHDPSSRSAPPKLTTSTTVIPPCTECGKLFSSWKALFGHMRCHPERTWRGINPPPQFRRQPPVISTPCGTHFSAEEYEVADSLILLASGPHHHHHIHHKRSSEAVQDGVGHKCGVCLRGFSSGQALGGHMRCHWEIAGTSSSTGNSLRYFGLDLNFPPPSSVNNDGETGDVLDLRLGV